MPLCERLFFPDDTIYRIEVPGIPPSPNASSGRHWGTIARDRRKFRGDAKLLALPFVRARGQPLDRVRITITIVRHGGRPFDPDAAISLVKPIIDGIVDAGLLRDDGPRYVEYAPAQQRLGPHKMTIIELVELDPLIA